MERKTEELHDVDIFFYVPTEMALLLRLKVGLYLFGKQSNLTENTHKLSTACIET